MKRRLEASIRLAALLSTLALGACAADASEPTSSSESDLAPPSTSAATAATPGLALSVHTTLGIPEAASATDPKHVLLVKPQYVTSFDSTKKNPRWTSWELSSAWIGSAHRSPSFTQDSQLPASFGQASDSDYRSSGYERGHICPSADRTLSPTDNEATFVFTNAVPQTAESNTNTWETLEREERTLAQTNHLFIIAGSLYGATPATIGAGVAIPTSMFKVVVVMQGAHPVPTDVTATTRIIAVEIPNTHTVSGDYRGYRTSMQSLESKTGLHFLSDVAPSIHDALATQIDTQ